MIIATSTAESTHGWSILHKPLPHSGDIDNKNIEIPCLIFCCTEEIPRSSLLYKFSSCCQLMLTMFKLIWTEIVKHSMTINNRDNDYNHNSIHTKYCTELELVDSPEVRADVPTIELFWKTRACFARSIRNLNPSIFETLWPHK